MVILDLGINFEGEISMNVNKSGRVKKLNGISKLKKAKMCVHQRMVDYHYNENAQPSGNLVCRECGAVIPDPAKILR